MDGVSGLNSTVDDLLIFVQLLATIDKLELILPDTLLVLDVFLNSAHEIVVLVVVRLLAVGDGPDVYLWH